MKRLKKLREYRSRLVNDVDQRMTKFIADGMKPERMPALTDFVRKSNFRVRIINTEIDKLIASDPRVLRQA
jgi:hypothetical protein